jgi:long-chain fatty acid transport protein
MRARLLAQAATALVILLPAPALADNLEEFGLGARAQGMGSAFTSVASDSTAAYYNPAGLIYSRHLNLSLGFSFADYALNFDSERGGDLDHQAERIPDLSAFTLGVSTTIPIDIPDRLGFGLTLFTPTRGIIDLEAKATTSEPEFFRYGARHDRLHLLAGLAVKITDWLSLGAGMSLILDAVGGTVISTGINEPVNPSLEIKLKPDAGAVAGVRVDINRLVIGFTYRQEHSLKLDFPATAVIQGITLPLLLETITYFSPHQIQFGISYVPPVLDDRLLIALDFSWVNWSAYDDAFLVVSSGVAAVAPRQQVDLDDVFSPKLGIEFVTTDWLLLRTGYWYRTSMVPDQDNQPTNLADGGKHVFTFGVGFALGLGPDEPSTEDEPQDDAPAQTIFEAMDDANVDIDLFFQLHLHPGQSTNRPASDPIGSWDADGLVFNFGFNFTARF